MHAVCLVYTCVCMCLFVLSVVFNIFWNSKFVKYGFAILLYMISLQKILLHSTSVLFLHSSRGAHYNTILQGNMEIVPGTSIFIYTHFVLLAVWILSAFLGTYIQQIHKCLLFCISILTHLTFLVPSSWQIDDSCINRNRYI